MLWQPAHMELLALPAEASPFTSAAPAAMDQSTSAAPAMRKKSDFFMGRAACRTRDYTENPEWTDRRLSCSSDVAFAPAPGNVGGRVDSAPLMVVNAIAHNAFHHGERPLLLNLNATYQAHIAP